MIVQRPLLTWYEKLYLPTIAAGLWRTWNHFRRTFLTNLGFRQTVAGHSSLEMTPHGNFTMQYPEEKWTMPEGYRGAPTLVRDEDGREKCVSCQLCEFVCPPRAITITPGSLGREGAHAHVEKGPEEFKIDMLRCIYCGLCEEVCPEEAIWLKKDYYALAGLSREEMVHDKKTLYEMGGTMVRPIKKWENK